MNHKQKTPPKTATPPLANPNRKKKSEEESGPWAARSSLFKKNESAMIIAGALAVTAIIFFVFFRSSDPKTDNGTGSIVSENNTIQDLTKRLASLEASLASLDAKFVAITDKKTDTHVNATLAQIQKQITRLESGFLVKIDSLTGQVENLEQRLSQVKKTIATEMPVPRDNKTQKKTTASDPAKETDSVFHTVEKGETLWRISQKYDTTVAKLRQLNNLAPDADIYPGTKILVR
jgi:LysM repeat protein